MPPVIVPSQNSINSNNALKANSEDVKFLAALLAGMAKK